jgi:hypoxanthine phosphoribosyltransferase
MKDWEVQFTEQEIQKQVKKLAKQISKDYENKNLLAIGVLKGACVFFSDLIRHIEGSVNVDFIIASSHDEQSSSGDLQIHHEPRETIKGRDILLIDEIIDTGITLKLLKEHLEKSSPGSIKICSLLDKKTNRQVAVETHYIGVEIPNKFVVGYGMDYEGRFRN